MADHPALPLGSRTYVDLAVSASEDLTGESVAAAFPPVGTAPAGWTSAAWVADVDNVARILITEPDAAIGGAVELDAGTFDAWVRVTTASETFLLPAGRIEIYDPSSTSFDRWGMTVSFAAALTGAANLSAYDLETAEDEIREVIGYAPRPDDYSTLTDVDGELIDRRVWALGRAIAWQAAHRNATPASADDAPVRISSESIGGGDHAVTFAGAGAISGSTISPRARRLLARSGWLAQTSSGRTRP